MTRACFYLQVPIYTHTQVRTHVACGILLGAITKMMWTTTTTTSMMMPVSKLACMPVVAMIPFCLAVVSFVRSLIGRNCHDTAVVTATTERLADAALNACHLSACTYNIV